MYPSVNDKDSLPTSDMETVLARQKSYIGPALITFFLYWLFYIPGLIVNVAYLVDASKVHKTAGQPPAGLGCLWALIAVFGFIPFAIGIIVFLFMALAAAVSGVSV